MSGPTLPRSRRLPRAVLAFGLVSLFTDASSEMIYPLLPLFLTRVLGASTPFVGTVEGVAESTAALFKLIAGGIADRVRRKKPLTVLGYGLSSIVRPLVGLASAPMQVLLLRFGDRVGKGIRSAPRDAILAGVTAPEARGFAYGFHRAMDNVGAVIGPALAALALEWLGLGLRTVFLCASIPAAAAMATLLFGVREPASSAPIVARSSARERVRLAISSLRLTPDLGRFFLALALFTLANSSDAFLLLLASRRGIADASIPLLWLLLSAVRALGSTHGGILSDRIGRRSVLLLGWTLYALVYLGLAFARSPLELAIAFVVYGIYYSLTEGTERALIADLAPPGASGRAFGGYHFIVGLLAFPASVLFGLVWQNVSPRAAFLAAALLAFLATVLLATLVHGSRKNG